MYKYGNYSVLICPAELKFRNRYKDCIGMTHA